MTFLRLLARNLRYHWRGNLAVFLGISLGSAVLTGALLVGDSLRGSLRELTLDRLGWVEEAMLPGRFFRDQLVNELHGKGTATPAILLSGSIRKDTNGRRAGGVTVLGVNDVFWRVTPPGGADFWKSDAAEVVLNRTLADLLSAQEGDTVTIYLQKPDDIPRESLLGKRKTSDVLQALPLKVRQVLRDEGLARFTLKPSPEPARNAFVPLRLLQSEIGQPDQANAILAERSRTNWLLLPRWLSVFEAADAGSSHGDSLPQALKLDDWGLRLRTPKDRALDFMKFLAPNDEEGRLKPARWRGRVPDALAEIAEANSGILTREQVIAFYEKHHPYISLESRQLFLAPAVVEAAQRAEQALRSHGDGSRPSALPILVYLVDTLSTGNLSMPYVVIAGVNESKLPGHRFAGDWLGERGMLLALPAGTKGWGSDADVAYYELDEHHHLKKQHASFHVVDTIVLDGAADDADLTPEFPGITDKLDIGEWKNPPFPYDRKRVKKQDEDFWRRHRATPRAYVSLRTAQQLWGSRFGNLTSVQFYRTDKATLEKELLTHLAPERGGFAFQPVRANAEKASGGSADFGVLFLSFSFFLIAAALLLVGLLVRLNLDRRASEIGLLLAIGWSHGRVRRLMLGEGAVLAVLGGAAGLAGALLYGRLMLDLLRANWPGGDSLNFLRLHAEPLGFVYGYLGSTVVSILTLVWATRVLGKLSPRALLAGETTPGGYSVARRGWPWSWIIAAIAVLGAAASVIAGYIATGQEAKAGSFFGSGALLLTACLAGVWIWLRYTGRKSTPRPSLTALGVRNAGRHAVRSLLTVGLLAAATFLIVAVESFHKDTDAGFLLPSGGSGGFALVAETDVPIFQDLNQAEVRKEHGLTDPIFAAVTFNSCRVRGGDDTSCLNLYQPLQPRVMSVPVGDFAKSGRFHFGSGQWQVLDQSFDNGAIPAVLDANTAEYILKKSLGDTVDVDNDRGEKVKLRVVGLLEESIFQSEVLVSEANFRKLFPRQEGYSFFLAECKDCSPDEVQRVQSALETALADQGVRVQTTQSRLQAYLAVENMYLLTFQALGGLGLVLGAVGLAIILLRGVWERRGELALLRALGFSSARLAWLVLAENLALLVLGLAAGTAAALVSVAPHLAGAGAHVLWLRIGLLLLVVLATGLVAGGFAVATTLRTPLLTALRRE